MHQALISATTISGPPSTAILCYHLPSDITEYITRQQKKSRANSTINNHLQVLEQAFQLAKLPAPEIPSLSVKGNARKGFLQRPQFDLLYAHLPADLRDFALFCYLVGRRTGAVKLLEWGDVADEEVHLRSELSKNEEPYCILLNRELAELIERRRQARSFSTPTGVAALSHYIFHRGDGQPIGEYRKAWATACKAAGRDSARPAAFGGQKPEACTYRRVFSSSAPEFIED